jgi:hypothetical protein
MAKSTNGRKPRLSRPLDYKLNQWPQNSTALVQQSTQTARACDQCGWRAPRLARHVERPGSRGVDCCGRCFRWLAGASSPLSTPQQEVARANWRELFRQCRPRVACGLGGIQRAIVSIPTPPATPASRILANFANGLERRAV